MTLPAAEISFQRRIVAWYPIATPPDSATREPLTASEISYHFRLVETIFEPGLRWVPWRAWPAFERDFGIAQAQLRAALETYSADYTAIREETVLRPSGSSPRAGARLSATGHSVAPGSKTLYCTRC